MRVLNIIPSLCGGGAERQFSYLAQELSRMGHEVHVAYCSNGPHKPELNEVVLHKLKTHSNYNPLLLWQLVQLIRNIKPDIIHTWIRQMDIWGGIASRILNIPWIFREPASNLAYTGTWKQRLRIYVGSGASSIVSNSRSGYKYWESKLPWIPHYLVKNALPLDEISQITPALPPEMEPTSLPIIIYVGRLEEVPKNPMAFLEAVKLISSKQKVIGVLCGEGIQKSELLMYTNNHGLERMIFFAGHLPATQVWALMKKASVFVSPSLREGCPNSVMEAMACECSLVLSDIPAHHEIVADDCAMFFDPSNIKDMAEKILKSLIIDKELIRHKKMNMQKAKTWSMREMAEKYETIYKELIFHI